MNVLLVEDNPDDALLAIEGLQAAGHRVRHASTLQEAEDMLSQSRRTEDLPADFAGNMTITQHTRINVILCDLGLPRTKDRYEPLERLKSVVDRLNLNATVIPWTSAKPLPASQSDPLMDSLRVRGFAGYLNKNEVLGLTAESSRLAELFEDLVNRQRRTSTGTREKVIRLEVEGQTDKEAIAELKAEIAALKRCLYGGDSVRGIVPQIEALPDWQKRLELSVAASGSQVTQMCDRTTSKLDKFEADLKKVSDAVGIYGKLFEVAKAHWKVLLPLLGAVATAAGIKLWHP